jgi:hypothetical protein
MTLNERETLLYAGWLCDNRGWYRPGQTVRRVNQREATQIQAVKERAVSLFYGKEQENSLSI